MFDNTPLALAQRMATWRAALSDRPHAASRFLFVDPATTSWQRPAPRAVHSRADKGLLGTYWKFARQAVRASREAALVVPVEQEPDLARHRLEAPARSLAVMGEPLFNMLGFFEEDFRMFDFYLGMATARWYLEARGSDDGAALAAFRATVARRSPRFACVDAYVDAIEGPHGRHPLRVRARDIAACRRIEPAAVPDLQTASDRTSAHARDQVRDANLLALLETSQAMRAHLERLPEGDRREAGEILGVLVEQLDRHGFQFVDLTAGARGWLGRRIRHLDAAQARVLVRDTIEARLAELARRQPLGQRIPVRVGTQTALNHLAYRDPPWVVGVGVKRFSAELTIGRRIRYGRARVDLLARLGEFLSYHPFERSGAPRPPPSLTSETSGLLRLDLAVVRRPVLQMEVAAGGGVWEQFSWRHGQIMWRPGLEFGVMVGVLQRVYVELAGQLFLDGCDPRVATSSMRRACVSTFSPRYLPDVAGGRLVGAIAWRFLPPGRVGPRTRQRLAKARGARRRRP